MKIDLSKKQIGDMVFTAHGGWVEIVEIYKKYNYPILTKTQNDYNMEGKYFDKDKHPTAFNSREEFDAYWAQVKE
jgi:hypothetical protein